MVCIQKRFAGISFPTGAGVLVLLLVFTIELQAAQPVDHPVIVGVLENWPPQYSLDGDTGKPEGFAIDIMNAVSRLSGLKVEYRIYREWPRLNQALREKEIDVIPNMGIIEERKRFMQYTAPVETTQILFFIRKTSTDIKSVADLEGRPISVVDTNKGRYLMEERGWPDLRIYQSLEEALMALIGGVSDAFVYPDPPLNNILKNYGLEDRVRPIGKPLLEVKRAIAVHKDNVALFKTLDAAVDKLLASREYKTIYTKWYGTPRPFWTVEKLAVLMGAVVIVVGLSFFLWRFVSVLRLNRNLVRETEKRRRAEIALRESEERFELAMKFTHDGLFDWNLETNQIYYSPGWKKMLGYEDWEIKNEFSEWERLTDPEDVKSSWSMLNELLAGNRGRFIKEFKMRHKDGRWVDILSRANIVFNAAGKGVRVVGAHMDITDRKQAEKKLEAALNEKEVLIQEINHRVKNNMQVIISLLRLQADRIADEGLREIFRESQSRIYAMAAVHQILHQSESLSSIDLNQYVALLTQYIFLSYPTDEGRISLVLETSPVRIKLEQSYAIGLVINELLSNALKYGFPDGRRGKITVAGGLVGDQSVRLVVADDGVGPPPDLDWRKSEALGLRIVRTLVESQLEGSIRLDATDGARWEIIFPR